MLTPYSPLILPSQKLILLPTLHPLIIPLHITLSIRLTSLRIK